MSLTPIAAPAVGTSPASVGCPFIVGRALQSDETIFGRALALQAIGEMLRTRSSVNLVGERRMGKTSVLNHLPANLPQTDGKPPFVLARLELQAHIDTPHKFYGAAWRELIAVLPPPLTAFCF